MRQADEHDDERRDEQQRRRVVGQPGAEAHDPVLGPPGPGDDHQPEHEQGVDEDRAEDRGLGHDLLVGLQREDDHEELGQVAERRLHEPVAPGPKRRPSCSVANDTIQASPASDSAAKTNAMIGEMPLT